MKSLSSLGLGLSIVFGSLLLALAAELYYLLWWKKRLTSKTDVENFFYMFCLKASSSALNPQENTATNNESHHQFIMELKPFDGHGHGHGELMVPPRFLFTIVEETKEDLECCDQESNSKGKFCSMLINVNETPYLTPLASPPRTPPPPMALLESASDAEFNKIIRSSPPPEFKFLEETDTTTRKQTFSDRMRPLEEKLNKRVDNDNHDGGFDGDYEDDCDIMTPPSKYLKDDEGDESFITINVDRSKELGFNEIN